MRKRRIPRLAPDVPFPPYAYVPVRFPHPVRNPKGHSYGKGHEKMECSILGTVPFACPPPAEGQSPSWRQCRPYVYGIDLFNHGYYWEAHDAWESVWFACGKKGVMADFLKGLIRLAAAGVKAREGRKRRVQQQAKRAGELFQQTACAAGSQKNRYMGLSLTQLIGFVKRLQHNPIAVSSHDPVKVVFRFKLRPLV